MQAPPRLQAVLLDIEGTTTAIDFVHGVLFPYATRHLSAWLARHAEEERVRSCLEQVREVVRAEGECSPSQAAIGEILQRWIAEDRKQPSLKQLQGFVWRDGYESGAFTGHLYADVPGCLRAWKNAGLTLAVYSSGSIEAQRLLFKYSDAGDLSALLDRHFDATIGGKREPAAYAAIARAMRLSPGEIVFLSDTEAELDAAKDSGLRTLQLLRGSAPPSTRHPGANEFVQVERMLDLLPLRRAGASSATPSVRRPVSAKRPHRPR